MMRRRTPACGPQLSDLNYFLNVQYLAGEIRKANEQFLEHAVLLPVPEQGIPRVPLLPLGPAGFEHVTLHKNFSIPLGQ